jgi:putative Holliday junction resolvase
VSRVLGLDYGTKRLGLAISDADRSIASPLAVWPRQTPEQEAGCFRQLIRDEGISLLVVGLPVRTTGSEGEKARAARQFGSWLHRVTGLPVVFWDERFTTQDAQQLLGQAGLTRQQRRRRLDMVAAQILLQSYLDAGCPTQASFGPLEDPQA